jgi:C2 domain
VLAIVAAAVVGLGTACTSEAPSGPATYCSAAKAASTKCAEPSSCDEVLTTSCTSLESVLTASTLKAAQDCLESGICGVAACLTRARKAATPSDAHRDLAESYCKFCAPDITDCESQFYAKKGKLPGGLVLPYGEAVATAVNDECTSDRDACRSKFATCATETIARIVGETLDAELADCVVGGFASDDDGSTGPNGGAEVSTCTPANCAGCCRDDRCEEGTSESACGEGGGACETCNTVQKCAAGTCKEPCGPNNCKGCCDGDTCLPGNATDTCGGEGGACTSCTTQGASFVCSNHQCIDGSCQATCVNGCCTADGCQPGTAANACGTGGEACIDCGYGRTCGSAKACAIDPNATWDFYVSFADIPDVNKSGGSWDVLNGAADPYLVAYSSLGASSHTGQTSVQSNTHIPFWAEVPLKGIKAAELLNNLSFEIWDEDVDYDDLIGGCSLPLTPAIFDGSLQSHVCPATASTVSVELWYRIRQPL